MSVFHNNVLAGAAGQTGGAAADPANITKSVRFNKDDTAYLSRTPGSGGNRKTWTWSGWVKLGRVNTSRATVWECTDDFPAANSYGLLNIDTSGRFGFGEETGGSYTTAKLRDHASFYHLVAAMDTTQSTAADRFKTYINGVEVANSGYTYTENADTAINKPNTKHSIGRDENTGNLTADMYMTDVYFIDGQQLDCTSFGAFDSNGVWQATAYSGTFGTNGFHLFDFENITGSSYGESWLGNDTSGNGNDFTANNIIPYGGTGSYTSGISYGNRTLTTYDKDDVVDGDLTSGYIDRPVNNNGLNFSSIPQASTSVRIHCAVESGTMSTNAGTLTTATGSDVGVWKTVDTTYPFTLTSITVTGGSSADGFYIYGIEVDGVVLVDTNSQSATAGDLVYDVPINGDSSDDTGAGGELSSNYCTWNPLDKESNLTLSNGNLEATDSASGFHSCRGTQFYTSNKWYWEVTLSGGSISGGGEISIGVATNDVALNVQPGSGGPTGAIVMWPNGGVYKDGSSQGTNSTYTVGDTIGVALDQDNHTVKFYKNGTLQSTSVTGVPDSVAPFVNIYGPDSSTTLVANFGQRAYKDAAPSGHKACCTSNFATPTIADGSDYFEAKAYIGNGSSQSISTGFSPDLVWLKSRDDGDHNGLFDTHRGALYRLVSDYTYASTSRANTVTAFNSGGFSLGSSGDYNGSSEAHIAWTWDAGTSPGESNTDGSITSTVTANTTAGFSIVAWTGTGSAETVGHGLGAKPEFIFSHRISASGQWPVYHSAYGATHYQYLNSDIEARDYQHFWNDTEPTSSVFSIGVDPDVSANGGTHIAYCISPVAGYSAVGQFTGNGSSSNGPFVALSFRPAFVMIKCIDSAQNWVMIDSARNPHNVADEILYANYAFAESTSSSRQCDFLSNGIKIRGSDSDVNTSGDDYAFIAFAENPFQANGGLAR